MKDRDFLIWIHERLEHIHGENPLVDYMHKLRAVIYSTPAAKETPNIISGNSLDDIKMKLKSGVMPMPDCTCEFMRQSGDANDRIHCPVHGLEIAGCTCHKNPLRDYGNRTKEEECPIHGVQ